MQFRFFVVPVMHGEESAAELNRFLSGHRITTVERRLIPDGENSIWAVCVGFDESATAGTARVSAARRGKLDYKDILSEPEFAVFARLRALRKERADAEGVPAYAVFTNEQLADIVQRRVVSLAALREIAGVGEARADKYGEPFLRVVKDAELPASVEMPPNEA